MILADKIIEERKRNGWSQEELADQLNVSRQAVSKWESAGSIPDLDKIVKMADIFGVSIDYLLKDEMIREELVPGVDRGNGEDEGRKPLRKVSMEEAKEFLEYKRQGAPLVANATSLCIMSPILTIILGAMAEEPRFHITEALVGGLGCTVLFAMVAIAVYLFISYGTHGGDLRHLERDNFETAYGVSSMVKEKRRDYEHVFSRGIAIGVVLCIVSIIPVIIAGSMEAPDYVCALFTALMLFMIAFGVNMMVRVAMIKAGYDALLQEGDYSNEEKRLNKKTEAFSSAYWLIMVAAYLAWSFITENWDITWIIWPIAGVLFAAVKGIFKMRIREK